MPFSDCFFEYIIFKCAAGKGERDKLSPLSTAHMVVAAGDIFGVDAETADFVDII